MASFPADDRLAVGHMTLAVADRLCADALEAARELGFAAAVAVVDAGGHLVAFRRDDAAGFVTAAIAQRKAWTAASSGMPTERWNALTLDPDVAPLLYGTGIVAVTGGVPLMAGDRVIGAIGVSGGTAAQDGAAAASAIAAKRSA